MSAGNMSLTSSLNICRVGSGEAPRIASDRYLNPGNMLCPVWTGYNLKGQQVCPDSFWTKSPGCNSPLDRIVVESNLRPDYASFVTLNMAGVKGEIFGNPSARSQVNAREQMLQTIATTQPQYGQDLNAEVRSSGACGIGAYEKAMQQLAQTQRQQGMLGNSANSFGGGSCGN